MDITLSTFAAAEFDIDENAAKAKKLIYDVSLWVNVTIFILAVILESYLLIYKLRLCRFKNGHLKDIRLLDSSAILIICFYNASITIKMADLIVREATGKNESEWFGIPLDVAIIFVWVMLYVFVFEMKAVHIIVKSESAEEHKIKMKRHGIFKLVALSSLILSLSV